MRNKLGRPASMATANKQWDTGPPASLFTNSYASLSSSSIPQSFRPFNYAQLVPLSELLRGLFAEQKYGPPTLLQSISLSETIINVLGIINNHLLATYSSDSRDFHGERPANPTAAKRTAAATATAAAAAAAAATAATPTTAADPRGQPRGCLVPYCRYYGSSPHKHALYYSQHPEPAPDMFPHHRPGQSTAQAAATAAAAAAAAACSGSASRGDALTIATQHAADRDAAATAAATVAEATAAAAPATPTAAAEATPTADAADAAAADAAAAAQQQQQQQQQKQKRPCGQLQPRQRFARQQATRSAAMRAATTALRRRTNQ